MYISSLCADFLSASIISPLLSSSSSRMERGGGENHGISIDSSSAALIGGRRVQQWPTIDGPLGLSEQDAIWYARNFFNFGFLFLPALWAVNCYLFWPVLVHSCSFPQLRPYVVRSAISFAVFATILGSWALIFVIGGERLFGPVWNELVMYNVADKYGLTGWT